MRRLAAKSAWLSVLLILGCAKPLFPKNVPRTQYAVHDQMRGGFVPLEEPDVFGNPQPALRARLSRRY